MEDVRKIWGTIIILIGVFITWNGISDGIEIAEFKNAMGEITKFTPNIIGASNNETLRKINESANAAMEEAYSKGYQGALLRIIIGIFLSIFGTKILLLKPEDEFKSVFKLPIYKKKDHWEEWKNSNDE